MNVRQESAMSKPDPKRGDTVIVGSGGIRHRAA